MSTGVRVHVTAPCSRQPPGLPEGDAAPGAGGPGRAVPCSCPTTLKLWDVRVLATNWGTLTPSSPWNSSEQRDPRQATT